MNVHNTIPGMRKASSAWRTAGRRIVFVPTMGCLHDGHLSLIRIACRHGDAVVASIYVNPTQFGPGEDYDAYPRNPERDEALCESEGVDAVFYPADSAMYCEDHSTWVDEESLSRHLCGASRPGHFRGVATVVTKLFNIVQPDVAVFGQKDAQQALLLQRVVRDLNMPVDIVLGPIVREQDGLAMSSRNSYLRAEDRRRALAIVRGLQKARQAYDEGERRARVLREAARRPLVAAKAEIDYVDVVARRTLEPYAPDQLLTEPSLLAVAAVFGGTRLIDNCFLG